MSCKLSKRHYGVVVPMVTPLTSSFDLDEEAVERLIEHVLNGGVHGVFVLGTTGEAASLPLPVRRQLVRMAVEFVGGRVRVYAGVADNSLADAIAAANYYVEAGADSIVVRLPSYYQLSEREQLEYLSRFVQETSGDVIIYNIPSLTHIPISLNVIDHLSVNERVVGIKDSTFNSDKLHQLISRFGGRDDFSVFTGPASMSAEMLAAGADGIIPAFSNAVPELCVELYKAAQSGDRERANELQGRLDQIGMVCKGLPSPAAMKSVVNVLGLCGPTMMPPLVALGADEQLIVEQRMLEFNLIPEQVVEAV